MTDGGVLREGGENLSFDSGKDPAALDAALADSYRVVEGLLS
jgi:hypothetical protein